MSAKAARRAAAAQTAAGRVAIEARGTQLFAASFSAMASPCEVLFECSNERLARDLGELAAGECWRIERRFSRYREDSIVAAIQRAAGTPFEVDAETASLLDFARECHELSGGLFDITSGVLRRAWKFDGSANVPTPETVAALLPLVGFGRLEWLAPRLVLPRGMELDFGGIGKEYAVDRVHDLLSSQFGGAFLVNLGGDLRARAAPAAGAWRVGIERPDSERDAVGLLELASGALATSGDARRFLLKDGVRYGHVLDPRTGWPVAGAPRSVTVAAPSATEAGLLATLALLHGPGAREFLADQDVRSWIVEQ